MGALTEREIFDCLAENYRLAAECCETLATSPRKGPTYRAFLGHIDLIEGACRQAAVWREDARWFAEGLRMQEIHRRAGEWLRGVKVGNGPRVMLAPGHQHPLFKRLAEILRARKCESEMLRDKATGKLGIILPTPQAAPTRTQDRPMQVLLPSGMIPSAANIIAPSATVQ